LASKVFSLAEVGRFIVVVKKTFRYLNVFFYNRTRAYAAIPQLRNFEHYYEKRYNRKINRRLMKAIANPYVADNLFVDGVNDSLKPQTLAGPGDACR